jgi:hypothetical protein
MFNPLRTLWRLLMTLEDQVNQILANQATIITNQGAILTAIKEITPGDSTAITAALTQIETQVTAIQGQFSATPAPAPTPASSSTSGAA